MKAIILPALVSLVPVLTPGCQVADGPASSVPPPPASSVLETDTLIARPGYTGKVIGASVTRSSPGPDGDLQVIHVNVPVDPDRVDRVQVVSESGETLKQKRVAEIIRNYETDNVGITIYLSKDKDWRFKLRLIDNAE